MSAIPLFLRTNMLLVLPIDRIATKLFWKGGTPGAESNWNTASNWSTGKVPTANDSVIISDVSSITGHFPIIDSPIPEIAHLEIQRGASLKIEKTGIFIINGSYVFSHGINCRGSLINRGQVIIVNTGFKNLRVEKAKLYNRGMILLDKPLHKGLTLCKDSKFMDLGEIKNDVFLHFLHH